MNSATEWRQARMQWSRAAVLLHSIDPRFVQLSIACSRQTGIKDANKEL